MTGITPRKRPNSGKSSLLASSSVREAAGLDKPEKARLLSIAHVIRRALLRSSNLHTRIELELFGTSGSGTEEGTAKKASRESLDEVLRDILSLANELAVNLEGILPRISDEGGGSEGGDAEPE